MTKPTKISDLLFKAPPGWFNFRNKSYQQLKALEEIDQYNREIALKKLPTIRLDDLLYLGYSKDTDEWRIRLRDAILPPDYEITIPANRIPRALYAKMNRLYLEMFPLAKAIPQEVRLSYLPYIGVQPAPFKVVSLQGAKINKKPELQIPSEAEGKYFNLKPDQWRLLERLLECKGNVNKVQRKYSNDYGITDRGLRSRKQTLVKVLKKQFTQAFQDFVKQYKEDSVLWSNAQQLAKNRIQDELAGQHQKGEISQALLLLSFYADINIDKQEPIQYIEKLLKKGIKKVREDELKNMLVGHNQDVRQEIYLEILVRNSLGMDIDHKTVKEIGKAIIAKFGQQRREREKEQPYKEDRISPKEK